MGRGRPTALCLNFESAPPSGVIKSQWSGFHPEVRDTANTPYHRSAPLAILGHKQEAILNSVRFRGWCTSPYVRTKTRMVTRGAHEAS